MGNSRSKKRRKESFVFAASAISEIHEHETEHSDSSEYDSDSDESDSSDYDIDDDSDQLQKGPAYYSFHPQCGDNVLVSSNRRLAKRRRPLSSFNDGVAMTEQHLLANESLKVQIKSMVDKWWGSIEVGVTSLSPKSLDFPSTMTESTSGSTVMWSGNSLQRNGEVIMTLEEDLDYCTVGDTISMTLSEEGSLHFGLNGEEVTTLNLHLYFRDVDMLHCVVDLFGRTDSAVICESGYVEERSAITSFDVQTSPTEEDYEADPDSVIKQMRMLVLGLREFAEHDIDLTIKLVYLYILQPTMLFDSDEFKQKFGDHLANLGVADELKFLLDKLMSEVDPMNTKWDSIEVVLVTLMNCTDFSLKLCRLCGQCGLVNDLLNNIHKYRDSYDDDEKMHSFIARSIDVLHNCSIAADNRQIYRECGAIEKIAPYVRSDDTDTAATALLTLSHIIENSKKHLLEAEDNIIEFIVRTLDVAIDDESLRCEGFGVLELVVGIGNISIYDKNKISLVNNGIVPLLLKIMQKDAPVEQECAINALCTLCKLESIRKKIAEQTDAMKMLIVLAKGDPSAVKQAAERAIMLLKPPLPLLVQKSDISASSSSCGYRELCRRFKNTVHLTDAFFAPRFDMCYCNSCHIGRGDELYYSRGQPPKDYGLPIGWCRFAIQLSGRAAALDVFRKWHTAFHGTHLGTVKPILECGDLLMPGDIEMEGKKLGERPGHFTEEDKPDGFDTKQIFLSPSIRYSGCDVYAYPSKFEDDVTKKTYSARVAFQVWIKPNSYSVGPETIGAKSEIDPKFSNQELEWFTKRRGCVIVSGLLIKLE